MASSRFVGWIPNVGGRLSFSHIGHTNHPKKCSGLNENDPAGRVIVCTQERPSADALVNATYLEFVYGYETTLYFVLVAETKPVDDDAQGKLEGSIFVFSRSRWTNATIDLPSPADWLGAELDTLRDSANSSADLASALRASLAKIDDKLGATSAYVVRCEIFRSGKTVLELSKTAEHLEFAPSITRASANIAERDVGYICNQAFMFLKDVAHNHRHHHKKQDTITLAYPEDGKLSWIRDTAYSIHRRVIVKRRSASPKEFYDALGLMSYMASLKKLAEAECDSVPEEEKETAAGAKIAASYNLKETEDSIKATLEKRRWQRTQWNIVITAVPAIVVFVGSLLKPVGDNVETKTAFSLISDIARFLFPYDMYGAVSLIIILATVPWIYGAINPASLPPVDYIKRVLVLLNQRSQVLTFRYIGISLLCVAFMFTAMAFVQPSQSIRSAAWWCAGLSVGSITLFLALAPYVPTLPDLSTKLLSLGSRQRGRKA